MQFECQHNLISLQKACHHFKGIVFSSPTITENMGKFGLTPAEFLRPFFQLTNKVRVLLGQREKWIEEFSVNLLDVQEYQASSREVFDRQTKEVIREFAPPTDILEVTSRWTHKPSVNQMVDANKTPWLHQNQTTVADFSSHAYHLNFIDQPVILVYVVSGTELDIMKEIHRIKQENDKFLKALFALNPQDIEYVKRFILIMNDSQEKVQYNQEEKVRKEFQNHICKVMPYNLPGSVPLNIWSKTFRRRIIIQGLQSKQPISIIDEQALKSYRDLFGEFLQYQIVMKLEKSVNVLIQANTEARRKPISDSIFNLFQTKEQQRPEVDYQMTQREFCLRYLADINFLLQEYDNAAEYYKTLLSELKSNKTRTNLATLNTLEYLTYSRLCNVQGVQGKLPKKESNDIFASFEEVQAGYIAEKQTAFILRLVYYYLYAVNIYQRYIKEPIQLLQRTNKYLRDMGNLQKPDHFLLFSTMIFEQIAFMYLRLDPPQYRKFAHNLTIVASRYEGEGYKRNSLRCYRIVEAVYRESQWIGILTWLQCHLGANYIDCDRVTEGIDSFKQAFNFTNDRQNIDSHNQLVTDWKKAQTALDGSRHSKELYSKAFANTKCELKSPLLKSPVDILVEDDWVYQFDKKKTLHLPTIQYPLLKGKFTKKPTQLWLSLKSQGSSLYEENLLKSMDSQYVEEKISSFNKNTLINTQRLTDLQDKYNQYGRQTFVNDPITLRVIMQSQLKVPSEITNLRVIYEFYTSQQNNQDLLQINDAPDAKPEIVLSTIPTREPVSFSFQRPQTEIVEVTLVPTQPGFLTIKGIQWDLFEIPSSQVLNYDLKDQQRTRTINFFNKFNVRAEAPQLELSLVASLDPEIFFGEVRPLKLCLKNNGKTPILSIEIIPLESYHFGFRRVLLDEPLQPQCEREYQIHIRCSLMDNFSAKLLFRYKVDDKVFRYTRMLFPMQVKGSFKITQQHDQNVDNWRFTLIVQEYFKGMMDQNSSLNFSKVLCVNELWEPITQNQTLIQQSHEEQFIFVTFTLKKLQQKHEINSEIFKKRIESFINDQNMVGIINLGGQEKQSLSNETINNFINEDIRYYFNSFYTFDENDATFEFPLFLVILWTLNHPTLQRSITGMHEIPFASNHFLLSRKKQNTSQELPISIKIDVLPKFEHDFNDQPFLEVPVKIKVKNSKFHYSLKLKLDFVNGDEQMKAQADSNDPSFVWNGNSSIILQLESQEVHTIESSVLFFQSGLFDLSRIKITVYMDLRNDNKKDLDVREYFSSDYEQVFVAIN